MEEESNALEFTLEDEYQMAPKTSEVIIRELIPIEQGPESGEAIQEEGHQSCRCRLEDHPIIISDEEVTITKNIILVRIQVEHPLPVDHVISHQ